MKNQDQSSLTDEIEVRSLYAELLGSWNNSNAITYASFFTDNANVIGFDGSQINGKSEILNQISEIFEHHNVSAYISIVREVRSLSAVIFVLRAVAGMVPPGGNKINPAVNAIQTLIAVKEQGQFKIAVFQNTPAAFHGRPELSRQLSEELNAAFAEQKKTDHPV